MIIWIASYPKSGNTWLRSIITSLLYTTDGIFDFKLIKKIKQFPTRNQFQEFTRNFNDINEISKFWLLAQDKINLTEELQVVDHLHKIDAEVERIASLREAVDNKLDIAVDFHGRVHAPMAELLIKAIEPYSPLFIEEPVLSERLGSIAQLRRSTHIRIATGERLYSRFDYKHLFTLGAADIIQPDLSHAGCITECKKIAAMAESWDLALAPLVPWGLLRWLPAYRSTR